MIILKLEGLVGYQKLIDRFRRAQEKDKIKQRLPGILKTFLDEGYSKDPFLLGISPDKVKSIESNSPNTLDVLFEDIFSPWVNLQFLDDFTELLVRGGPAIYNYLFEDEHCQEHWTHTFSIPIKLDSALLTLADLNYLIRETEVQPYERIVTIEDEVITRPVRFPRSSATKTSDYLPTNDFEIREEILPLSYLPEILKYLRANAHREISPKSPSVVYAEKAFSDPSKIPRESYQSPRNHLIHLKK